jgi:dTDP-4-amino-4,6-dideoxygalactose transaminase
MSRMLERGIATRRGVQCAHREEAHRDVALRLPLPHSEQAQDRCILLPLHAELSDPDQDRVTLALREALRPR